MVKPGKRNSDEVAQEDRIVTWGLYWTEATIFQITRVRDAHNWASANGYGSYPNQTTEPLEQQNLLTAANKARRWLLLAENPPWEDEPVAEFLSLLKDSKLVRDKREHEEEYGPGGKDHPMSEVDRDGSGMRLIVSPGVTVIRNGRILLGGVVDVDKLLGAAEKAAEVVRLVQHRQAPAEHFKTAPGLRGPKSVEGW